MHVLPSDGWRYLYSRQTEAAQWQIEEYGKTAALLHIGNVEGIGKSAADL